MCERKLRVGFALIPFLGLLALSPAARAVGGLEAPGPLDHGRPSPALEACPGGGELHRNDDSTFESGYAFQQYVDPPINSFAEVYDLGRGTVRCGVFWFCALDSVPAVPNEVYVWDWDSGQNQPGAVLARVQGVDFPNVGIWPEFREDVVPIDVEVDGRFAIGFWSGFDGPPVRYIGADLDGQGGFPLMYTICFDYPDWCSVDLIWGPTQSLGIEVSFEPEQPTPVRESTWGAIKALYQ